MPKPQGSACTVRTCEELPDSVLFAVLAGLESSSLVGSARVSEGSCCSGVGL